MKPGSYEGKSGTLWCNGVELPVEGWKVSTRPGKPEKFEPKYKLADFHGSFTATVDFRMLRKRPFRTAVQLVKGVSSAMWASILASIGRSAIPEGFRAAPVARRPKPDPFFVAVWFRRKHWRLRRVEPSLLRRLGKTLADRPAAFYA